MLEVKAKRFKINEKSCFFYEETVFYFLFFPFVYPANVRRNVMVKNSTLKNVFAFQPFDRRYMRQPYVYFRLR